MACEIDFVTVVNMEMKIEQGYNIKIKPYWRELPHEKGWCRFAFPAFSKRHLTSNFQLKFPQLLMELKTRGDQYKQGFP